MAVDRREDPGEFYPDGKIISTRPIAGGGDMKHSDFADVEPLPERFTDEDVRTRFNQLVSAAKGASAAIAALLLCATTYGAGVTVQTAPKGTIYNDEHIVTNVVFDATGLAELTNVYTKAETEAKIVELAPAETDPTVPTWAKAANKPTYSASEVGAIPTTGGVFNASLHLNQKLSVGTWTSSVKPYDISGGSGIAFVFGDNVQTKRSNTMTLGVGALNTNEWSFIWNGDANRMYVPTVPSMSNPYATRYNGGFHVNPSVRSGMVNPLQNFWIGDTNLATWISTLALGKTGEQAINSGRLDVWGIRPDLDPLLRVGNSEGTYWVGLSREHISRREYNQDYDYYLQDASGILAFTSDIPNVPAWALAAQKPTYTASEVGAYSTNETMYVDWIGDIGCIYGDYMPSGVWDFGDGCIRIANWYQFKLHMTADHQADGIEIFDTDDPTIKTVIPINGSDVATIADIPTSMAWGAITGKPTTISGYGITDALKSDFTSLTNNAAFTSAVAAVSPPTDLTHVEAEIETNRTAIATLSARAYIEVVSADEVYYVFTTNQE